MRGSVLGKKSELLDTHELLHSTLAEKNIAAGILLSYLSRRKKLRKFAARRGWRLFESRGSAPRLRVEEKISQVNWLGMRKNSCRSLKLIYLKNISWRGNKFILQFNRSHTAAARF